MHLRSIIGETTMYACDKKQHSCEISMVQCLLGSEKCIAYHFICHLTFVVVVYVIEVKGVLCNALQPQLLIPYRRC
jgi:hypothetical protein